MNRFIEKKRECYALKSRDLIADISTRQYLSTYDDKLFLEELKGALRLANCIALAPDIVPEKRPVFESLNRASNEWQSIGRQAWLKLYEEQKNRVCSFRTYGPTLRIKYPCGFVGFKGLPNQNGDIYADEPEAPPKSDDQNTLDTLLDLYYPDIRSMEMRHGAILKTEIEWSGKNRLAFSAEKPAPEPVVDEFKGLGYGALRIAYQDEYSSGRVGEPVAPTPETKKNTDQVNAVLGLWANCPQRVYGLVDKPKRDFGVTQTPKRSATDARTTQYLQVCGRGLRKPPIVTILTSRGSTEITQEVWDHCKAVTLKKGLGKSGAIPSAAFGYFTFDKDSNEWIFSLGKLEPERLDPAACRHFVEQLLAFDELEAKRKDDYLSLLFLLAYTHEISSESHNVFIEGYRKC